MSPNRYLSCQGLTSVVRWGGVDVWQLTSGWRQGWRELFFLFLMTGVHFFGEKNGGKNERNPFFLWKQGHSEAAEAQYIPTVHRWWDAQSKQTRQIELRGAHVKLLYYNNKQVLRVYIMLHVTVVLYVRSEDEHVDTVSIHSSLCDNENPTTHSINVGLDS